MPTPCFHMHCAFPKFGKDEDFGYVVQKRRRCIQKVMNITKEEYMHITPRYINYLMKQYYF